jgi:hypothetical protein
MLFEVDYRASLEDLCRRIIPFGPELERSLEEARLFEQSHHSGRRQGLELVEAKAVTLGVHMRRTEVNSRITQYGSCSNVWDLLSSVAAHPQMGAGKTLISLGGTEYTSYSVMLGATVHHVPCLMQCGKDLRELMNILSELTFEPAMEVLVIQRRTAL